MPISFQHVTFVYAPGSPLAKKGLDDVSFNLNEHQFIALIGHTGSGKSTLMQHLNALLKPTKGEVKINNFTITPKTSNKNLRALRKYVSLVFQFPETQLFENTVLDDIAFGPQNFGYTEKQAKQLAFKWLIKVGLSKEIANRSPFNLSGGQMRRVAIAGVLASQPQVLCLDEPTAGLDPRAHQEMMQLFLNYQKSGHIIILVTHNMDDVARYADDVLVLEDGHLIKHASPNAVFADRKWLHRHHLEEPTPSLFAQHLKNYHFQQNPITLDSLVQGIKSNLKG